MGKDLKILTIEEMEQESVRWVWKPFIALGKICLVQGDPGIGKSTVVLALAADMTNGRINGDSDLTEPAQVIYQTAEDVLCRGCSCTLYIILGSTSVCGTRTDCDPTRKGA